MKRPLFTGALLAALVVQVVHGVPAYAVAGLRAVACCARCHHGPARDAMRCCGVPMRDDTATAPALSKFGGPRVSQVPFVAPSTPGDSCVVRMADIAGREHAAPLFLVLRSLRL